MSYLGVSVSFASLKTSDWDFLVTKLLRKIEALIGNSASSGGRMILVNSSLYGIHCYFMSMFLLNKFTLEKLDKPRKRFF